MSPVNGLHQPQEAESSTPLTTPAKGKRKRIQAEQQQQGNVNSGTATPPPNQCASAAQAPAATVVQAERRGSSGKKRAGRVAGAPATSARKAVRINLRNNLYFEHGGPVPDPMVRTPPTARSKVGSLPYPSTAWAQLLRGCMSKAQVSLQGQINVAGKCLLER